MAVIRVAPAGFLSCPPVFYLQFAVSVLWVNKEKKKKNKECCAIVFFIIVRPFKGQ